MQAELTQLIRDLDQIAAKIEKSGDTLRIESNPKLQALRDQIAEWNRQPGGVRNATESTWNGKSIS